MFDKIVNRCGCTIEVPSPSLPPTTWELCRVTGPSLDNNKHWYVLTKSLCGCRPKDFATIEIFCRFPGKIQLVEMRELYPATKKYYHKNTRNIYVASWFCLSAALLRQREFPQSGFVGSLEFAAVQDAMN